MRKAVMLCNHYRSFEYIAQHIKDFFGDNTDYYVCTWDHDFRHLSNMDQLNLGYKSTLTEKPAFTSLPELYTPLDVPKISKFIEDFGVKEYKILKDEYFDEWAKLMPNVIPGDTKENKYSRRAFIGQFLPIKVCADMIRDSGEKYDVVFRLRMDCVPFNTTDKTLEEICNEVVTLKRNTRIFMENFKISKGMPHIPDRFFYGQQHLMLQIFQDLEYKINTLYGNELYRNKALFAHKLLGGLLIFTDTYIRKTPLFDKIVRKDFVDNKLDPSSLHDYWVYSQQKAKLEKELGLYKDK